jgi:hypothetical protein
MFIKDEANAEASTFIAPIGLHEFSDFMNPGLRKVSSAALSVTGKEERI